MRFAGKQINLNFDIDMAWVCAGACGLYATSLAGHFVATHLYVSHCAPLTALGFLHTIIAAPAPHCQLLRAMIFHFGDGINGVWKSVAATLLPAAFVMR